MVKYALLGLLREHADYGYRLKLRFEEYVGAAWRLNTGQVYQTLRRLERAGLVIEVTGDGREQDQDQDPHPLRRVFQLTPKGSRVLERWLQRPSFRPIPARDETLLRLLVLDKRRRPEAVDQIEKLMQLYTKRITALLAQKRRLLGRPQRSKLVRRVSVEAVLVHAEAHLKWLQFTLALLHEDAALDTGGGSEPVVS